jgi:hypothetical protein
MSEKNPYPVQGPRVDNPDGISIETHYSSKLAREADMSGCTPLVLFFLSAPFIIHSINSGVLNSLLSSFNK